ncbi:MAG TPA: DEAD/DEAH box helicase family protein, partial [Chitinophagaceae bacterium]|nr:DEAD/DEAH box helicase family protein [Chitinophagaceae bacterium]
ETYVILQQQYNNEDSLATLLNHPEENGLSRAPKQMELLLSYLHLEKTIGEVTKSALIKKSGASESQLKGLVEKNILRIEKRLVDRIQYLPKNVSIDFELSEAQQAALDNILHQFKEKEVCLLHGVTSSGKTNIYIKLIEAYIKAGKQVLYMLP